MKLHSKTNITWSICLIICSCSNQAKENSKQQTKKARPLKVQENYIDFDYSKIIAFATVHEQDYYYLFKENKLNKINQFDTISITLNSSQISLVNETLSGRSPFKMPKNYIQNNPADCFFPRHNIVFLNRNDSVVNFLSVCFECGNTKQSKFGEANFYELRMLFNAIGLPVFDRISMDNPHYEYYYGLVKKKKEHSKKY